jgi:biopolymer transport protein ExbD
MAIGKLPDADIEGSEDAIFAEINITPLTDIFLVLLIIFMVSSSVAVKEAVEQAKTDASSGLKVNLPSGAAQEIDLGRNSLVVGIQQNGQIVVNGQPVNEEDLDRLFLSAFTTDKDTQVVLKADTGVNHGRVVGVMERAKRVGLSRLAIATRGGG